MVSQNPENGTYKGLWMNEEYCISPCGPQRRFNPTPPWHDYASITFNENDEFYDDNYLSFVEDSLKLHKILAINFEIKCFNVTVKK
jgi:hypothetical protein